MRVADSPAGCRASWRSGGNGWPTPASFKGKTVRIDATTFLPDHNGPSTARGGSLENRAAVLATLLSRTACSAFAGAL